MLDTVASGDVQARRAVEAKAREDHEYQGDVGTKASHLAGTEENCGCVECE